MKLKILALAAFGLLAVASAAVTVPTHGLPSIQHDDKTSASAVVDAGAVGPATDAFSSDDCKQHCHVPLAVCVLRCGNGPDCEHKCSCELFGRRNMCVIRGCVPQPTCNRKEILIERDEPESAAQSIPPPPLLPCILCRAAIQRCISDCGHTQACNQDCRCINNGNNPNCNSCQDAYCLSRRSEGETLAVHNEQKGEPIAVEALQPQESKDAGNQEIDPQTGIGGWPPGTLWEVCDECNKSIKKCKKECGSHPACNTECACQKKQTSGSACHGCAKFKPKCHWPRNTPEDTTQAVDVSPKVRPVGPPPTGCQICMYSINECKRRCDRNDRSCDKHCRCTIKQELGDCRGCRIGKC